MKLLLPLLATLLVALLAPGAPAATLDLTAPETSPNASLEFIENRGQWDGRARYAAALPSGRLFAEADGLTFALLDAPALAHHNHAVPGAPASAADSVLRGHAVTLRFVGAAPTARLLAEGATAERRNYFLGADPGRWARDVRGFRRLRYAGLWPGVDARVYESAGQELEYDFELAAGADPAAIVLRHDGAGAVTLDAAGGLRIATTVGSITERAPRAWQTDAAGQRRAVLCRYQLAADGTVRFALGAYDRAWALTIDPVVVFATYSGAFVDNWGFTSTYDAQGNLYSGGIAFGLGFPTSSGAFRTSFAGIIDIAIIKYNTAVSGPAARVWATYLGGSSADFPTSLVVNSQGELLLLGVTSSRLDYPTTAGAVQRSFGGGTSADPYGSGFIVLPNGSDLVLTRFNAAGSALVGSTYLGGSGNDGLLPLNTATTAQLAHNYGDPFRGDLTVDAADNVYVASHTASTNFPLAGGFDGTYRGGATDGLVLKLTPALTALTWGSYLGGGASDAAYSVQVAPGGDVYVAGGTLSANFPATTGSYRPAPFGDVDGFVARVAADGSSLRRATYLGTAAYDQAYFLQLGTDGGVYVLGQTAGAYPTTPGLYRTANGRQFLHKLDPDLGLTQLATVFGSGRPTIDLDPTAFLVDRCDRVYVCGWGGSSNQGPPSLVLNGNTFGLPVTPGAMQATTDGGDFYLAQFSAGLTQLEYATFYGRAGGTGDHVDGGTARFDPRGVVYQAVCSCGGPTGFPILGGVNTFSSVNGSSNCNNAAFAFNFQPDLANAGTDQAVCATAGPLPLVGSPAGGVWTGPGVSGSVAAGFVFTPSLALVGTQVLTYTVASTGLCGTTDTRRMAVGRPEPVAFAPVGSGVFCRAATGPALPVVPLVGTPASGTFSGPGVMGGTFDPELAGPGTHTLTYTYLNDGCLAVLTQPVRVAFVSAGPAFQLCVPGPPLALVGTPAGGTWTGPGVTGSPAAGFAYTPTPGPAGTIAAVALTYSVTTTAPASAATCTAVSSVLHTVANAPVISVAPLPPLCVAGLTRQLLAATPSGGVWTGPGVVFNGGAYYFQPAPVVGTYPLTYTYATNFCPTTANLSVVVSALPTVLPPADTVLCPGSTQPFRLRATPAGGTWTGPGVTGSPAAGFTFTPPAGFAGAASLAYAVVNGGCTATVAQRVSVARVPNGVPTWAPDACPEARLAPLTLRFELPPNLTAPATSLTWEFGDGNQSADPNPVHTYARPGTYQPRVRVRYNAGRCETQLALPPVEVQERRVPNVITPNGDGLNETFRLGPDCPPRLQVFSRWGQLVFEAAAYRDDWDGGTQAAGVYYYLLTYPGGRRVKGWVEVVR